MPGEMRQGQHEPLTPLKAGRPPDWHIRCSDCPFTTDAHGATDLEALKAIRARHQPGHRLSAKAVNYRTGYGPDGTQSHPLYTP